MAYSFENSTVAGTVLVNIGTGGASYNGQLVSGATISTSDYRGGLASVQLSAPSSQYVQVPAFATGSSGLTFACWFRSNANGNWARIFDFGNGRSDNIFVYMHSNGLGVGAWNGVAFNQYDGTVYPNINDNQWRHFAWTLTPSGTWTVYINGNSVWSRTGQVYPRSVTRSNNYLGKSNWPDPFFSGAIDDWKMYTSALGADEVMTLYLSASKGMSY